MQIDRARDVYEAAVERQMQELRGFSEDTVKAREAAESALDQERCDWLTKVQASRQACDTAEGGLVEALVRTILHYSGPHYSKP